MKMKKEDILLFPCIEKNIGDDLFVMLICKRFPDKHFMISKKAQYGSLKSIKNLHFSKDLERYLSYTGRVPHNAIKRVLFFILSEYYRRKIGKRKAGVMIVGNAFKNYKYEGKTDSKWFEERTKLTDHFFLLSTNFGPYIDKQWRDDFLALFSKCRDICFRDKKSYDLFHELPNVRYAPDAVFSIGKIEQTVKERIIIVSVINCLTPGRPVWLNKCCDEYENKLMEAIDLLVGYNYKVVLLNSNDSQDNEASERIKSHLGQNDKVDIYHYKGDLNEVIRLYKQASGVVSTRLHTMILGFLADIPVFPIVYDEKVEGILKSVNFTGQYEDIRNISKLNADDIVSSMDKYSFKLSENIIDDANMQFAEVNKFLGSEDCYGN